MEWPVIVLLIAIVVLLIWLILLAHDMRESLHRIVANTALPRGDDSSHHGLHGLTNYCIWTNHGGSWKLVEQRFEPGYMAGDPPRRAGAYEGETVRKPAVRRF